jgi:alanine or glycine:cation symporter, AGCS family
MELNYDEAFVFVGAVSSLQTVWSIADIMNALMDIPYLIGLLSLSGVVTDRNEKNRFKTP